MKLMQEFSKNSIFFVTRINVRNPSLSFRFINVGNNEFLGHGQNKVWYSKWS